MNPRSDLAMQLLSRGEGPQLCCVHGMLGSAADWVPFCQALPDDWAVAAPELYGHGAAARPEDVRAYEFEQQVAALRQTLTTHGPDPVLGVGYSMGGRIVLAAALAAPHLFSGLVLIGAQPGLRSKAERRARCVADKQWAERARTEPWPDFLAAWRERPVLQSQRRIVPELRAALDQRRLQLDPEAIARQLLYAGTGRMPNLWPHLSQLMLPTLVVAGTDDEKFVPLGRRMAQALPVGTFAEIAGSGHTVHLEAPVALAARCVDWWEKDDLKDDPADATTQDKTTSRR